MTTARMSPPQCRVLRRYASERAESTPRERRRCAPGPGGTFRSARRRRLGPCWVWLCVGRVRVVVDCTGMVVEARVLGSRELGRVFVRACACGVVCGAGAGSGRAMRVGHCTT